MYTSACICTLRLHVPKEANRFQSPLPLKLCMALSHLTGVLGTESGPLEKQYFLLATELSVQPIKQNFKNPDASALTRDFE